jgi:hypothetical protein
MRCMTAGWAWLAAVASLWSNVPAGAQVEVPSYCSAYPPAPAAGQWQSSRVRYQNGRLAYTSDAEKNRIPDFSYAGYRYGEASLPTVAQVVRLTPAAGDNTARIQQALDQVGARTPDARGIRGAVVLAPGTYEIGGTLRVDRSGVVLRGAGDGGNAAQDTILRATGDTPHQRAVVVLGSGNSTWTASATRTNITTAFVPVGSLGFQVASTTGFAVGDNVLVLHPSTQAWIDAVDGGGTHPRWTPGMVDILYNRRIRALSGNTVTLDAPIYNGLDRSLSQSVMAKVSESHITEAGVEDLRIDIVTAGGEDEDHAWNGVNVNGAQDSWVRGVTALHFGYAGVRVDGSVRITIEECQALEPVGIRTGGRFYNFATNSRSQLILFRKCHAADGRHGLVSNGESSVSGVVFHRCTLDGGHDNEAGHRHWTQAVLFDNVVESGSGSLRLINRGDWGTSHGWGSTHSVAWNFNKGMLVQKPPTGQNYGISASGSFPTNFPWPGAQGFVEQRSGSLVPASLYEAQICDRLRPAGAPVEVTPSPSAVLASTQDTNVAGNAADDDLATRWSGNGDGAWLRFDLGSSRTIAFVTIAVYKGTSRSNAFDLQVSDDAMSWFTVLAGAHSSGKSLEEERYDFTPRAGRYLRYVGHGSTAGSWNSVTELSIFALP